MAWRPDGPRDFADQIKHLIVPHTRGTGLDVGCGAAKAWPHFLGVNDAGGAADDIVTDPASLRLFADQSVDFVFSAHYLQRIHPGRRAEALRQWWRVIRKGGHLVLYVPDRAAAPDSELAIDRDELVVSMRIVGRGGWLLLEDERRHDGDEWSLYQVYRRTDDHQMVEQPWRKPERSCLVVRFGGIGDVLQVGSVLPHLKRAGHHVTVMTYELGHDLLRDNPYVDAFIVQDRDQVPNENLGPYWWRLRERYDRIINYSSSIETALLPCNRDIQFHYSDAARRRIFDVNYLERIHDIADVPHEYDQHFYAGSADEDWARRQRRAVGNRPLVLWALTGSAIHKTYPHVDAVVSALLVGTNAAVIFVGGEGEREFEIAILEGVLRRLMRWTPERIDDLMVEHGLPRAAIQNRDRAATLEWYRTRGEQYLVRLCALIGAQYGHNRLLTTSGRWEIRRVLALAQKCDVVVGPETGVLNSVGTMPVPTVTMLSHSSANNLTRDWLNNISLTPPPDRAPCYPCHRLHYGPDFCHLDDQTGAALCAATIEPTIVFDAIARQLEARRAQILAETAPRSAVPIIEGAAAAE